jgi:predicted DCC family thiol-disulfide oxidoreductase YuxK
VIQAIQPESRPVVLFDGECGLCNRVVRLLLRLDRRGRLRFAPLQGAAGQAYLRTHALPPRQFSTLVFVGDWPASGFQLRTAGVASALRSCGGAGLVLGALLAAVPTPLRDAAYRAVARWRHRIFGPWKACPLPRPEWAQRFID